MTEKEDQGISILKHSVAFRVTDDEWVHLRKMAEANGTTVAKFTKQALFKLAKLPFSGR